MGSIWGASLLVKAGKTRGLPRPQRTNFFMGDLYKKIRIWNSKEVGSLGSR